MGWLLLIYVIVTLLVAFYIWGELAHDPVAFGGRASWSLLLVVVLWPVVAVGVLSLLAIDAVAEFDNRGAGR